MCTFVMGPEFICGVSIVPYEANISSVSIRQISFIDAFLTMIIGIFSDIYKSLDTSILVYLL